MEKFVGFFKNVGSSCVGAERFVYLLDLGSVVVCELGVGDKIVDLIDWWRYYIRYVVFFGEWSVGVDD